GIHGPLLAEALPGEHVDRTRAEERPHRHLDRAGVGARHDAELPVARDAEQRAAALDHRLQAGLRRARTVRAPEEGAVEHGGAPARSLGAGAGGELRALGAAGRLHVGGGYPLTFERSTWERRRGFFVLGWANPARPPRRHSRRGLDFTGGGRTA